MNPSVLKKSAMNGTNSKSSEKTDSERKDTSKMTYIQEYVYLGIVQDPVETAANPAESSVKIYQRNKFSVGEWIEIMKPDGQNIPAQVLSIWDAEGNRMDSAPHPQQELKVLLSAQADQYDLLRRKSE